MSANPAGPGSYPRVRVQALTAPQAGYASGRSRSPRTTQLEPLIPMQSQTSTLGRLSGTVVRLLALWLFVGAAYKLFRGSPNDLPPIVRELFLGPSLTFKLAIAIELSITFLALLRPRIGWALLALQMLVFIAILIQLIATGADSCGCFGSSVTMPPSVMLGIDGVGLVLMLLTQPWKNARDKDINIAWIAAALLLAWAAPWTLVQESTVTEASVDVETGAWKLPDPLPDFALLDPDQWVGLPLAETQLGIWMDVASYDPNAQWILYSELCDHCADFLRQREAEWVQDPKVYVLVTMIHATPERPSIVTVKPPCDEASLPAQMNFVMTPPWELTVEDGIVVAAVFRGDDDHE